TCGSDRSWSGACTVHAGGRVGRIRASPGIGRGSIGGGGGFGRGRDSPSPSERYAAPVVFLLPATILIVLFFMLPVVTTIGLSMTDISTLTFRQPKWVGLENYRALLGDPSVGRIMVNTARYVRS